MRKSFFPSLWLLLTFAQLPTTVFAGNLCDIDFAYGLVVNDHQVRILDKSRTVVQINGQDQLFVKGRWQALTVQQRRWLRDYTTGLHYVVPKMIVLATEGVDLAADTVDNVYQGLVGSDHESYEKLRQAMERVRNRVKDKFRHASNHYFIGPGSLESVDHFVDSEIEAQLEEAISMSVGGILSAIGGMDKNHVDISSERLEEITRQLGAVGEQLDMEDGAASLNNRAQWFCHKLKKLNMLEEKLRDNVPALQPFDIIISE
ncbi:YggN family protein [Alteromonas sp. C1M14]|nr:YggN family protein [Alteromonas sp. C1M14]